MRDESSTLEGTFVEKQVDALAAREACRTGVRARGVRRRRLPRPRRCGGGVRRWRFVPRRLAGADWQPLAVADYWSPAPAWQPPFAGAFCGSFCCVPWRRVCGALGFYLRGAGKKCEKGFRRLRRCDWKGANLEIGVPGKGGSAGRQAGSSVLCGGVRLGREMRNTVYVSARVCVSGRRTSRRRLRWSCLDLPDRI